jgi:hypothetical protein
MRDEEKMLNSALIDMVQWRIQMEIIDEQQSLRRIEWNPESRNKSIDLIVFDSLFQK